jgi:hypothetical protein
MIEVRLFDKFKREFKRLSKKFRTLPNELRELIEELENDPKKGVNLGGGLFKIRLASESKGGGKSGGFRVISYYIEQTNETETIYLVTIYDKSEESSIDKEDLLKIIKKDLGLK